MSLESIVNHILNEANSQKEKIIEEARYQKELILGEARQQAEKLYGEILAQERALLENQKQRLIVNANLDKKKRLLKTKQEAIDEVFQALKTQIKKDRLRKEKIYQNRVEEVAEDIDFYLDKIRLDYETEIARILFA